MRWIVLGSLKNAAYTQTTIQARMQDFEMGGEFL